MFCHHDYEPLIELAERNHIVRACIRAYPNDPKQGMQAMVIALAQQTEGFQKMITDHMMVCSTKLFAKE